MQMTKKKVVLGVAIIVAIAVLGWIFKPAPAEAAKNLKNVTGASSRLPEIPSNIF